ncbi:MULTISPECIES: DUF2165 domain-containing protein [unclassified Mycobacterium]|uniref:DUF2165 domain-containing protein n=1 Tax=unclassified Mycobacterium TaxID=2642494 RepID=UPI001BAFB4F8|nr:MULTISPECIES: DUF2165 domain-containing protein [unclassified Mycobacterium]
MNRRIVAALARFGTLRTVCTVLVGLTALYMILLAFGNITDFHTNEMFVRHVLAMDTTNFGQPADQGLDTDIMWRAIRSPAAQTAVYCLIIAWEALSGGILLMSVWQWLTGHIPQARAMSTVGLLMVILQFFGGFMVVGGEWFQMWRSTQWTGTEVAFRCSALALFTLMFVQFGRLLPGDQRETGQ